MKTVLAVAVLLFVAATTPISAGELTLKIANGRATLIAQDVPPGQILAEWARLGGTKIINGEKVIGQPITAQLIDRPEREVLDFVLRSASGYVAAPRAQPVATLSMYDRVLILATSQAPAYSPAMATTPTFMRPPPQVVDDDPNPVPVPAGTLPPGMAIPGVTGQPNQPVGPQTMPAPGIPTNQPLTASRPGMLPMPQPQVPNPYVPPSQGGVARPPNTGRGGGPGL